jgi:hypothetical protein
MARSREDVKRIVRREFPAQNEDEILKLLDSYGTESYHRERERVQLAVLKLAEGNIDDLLHYLSAAIVDYRDVLIWAEYARANDYPASEKETHDRLDREEYQSWFERP